jgi:hypothetical protein
MEASSRVDAAGNTPPADGSQGVPVMKSIVAEQRIDSVALPIVVVALCLFYMLGAAALVAETVKLA